MKESGCRTAHRHPACRWRCRGADLVGNGGALLRSIGGAASWGDAFMVVGSLAAQLLMVRQKVETWPTWVAVNTVGTVLYATQGLYFTSMFYAVLIIMAVTGWRAWQSRAISHPAEAPAAAHG